MFFSHSLQVIAKLFCDKNTGLYKNDCSIILLVNNDKLSVVKKILEKVLIYYFFVRTDTGIYGSQNCLNSHENIT